MATNPYFKNFKSDRQQYLLESQTMEVIKRYGHDIKYIPREITKKDDLFGEDVLSKFPDAATIEVYIKSVDGYEGQGRFMAKFGIEVRDKITFTMSRLRFTQIRTEKILQESGYTLQNEAKQKYVPNETHAFILEDGNSDGYTITFEKPRAGDLVYFPMVDKIFEITYVNAEAMFYQHGNLFTYDLECELFEYSSERFETEDADIDSINQFNTDVLNNELIGEDGALLQEDGGSFVNEIDVVDRIVPAANNNVFTTETDDLVDWTEINPLVDSNKSFKW
jgi:hypothetical protein